MRCSSWPAGGAVCLPDPLSGYCWGSSEQPSICPPLHLAAEKNRGEETAITFKEFSQTEETKLRSSVWTEKKNLNVFPVWILIITSETEWILPRLTWTACGSASLRATCCETVKRQKWKRWKQCNSALHVSHFRTKPVQQQVNLHWLLV